LDLLQNNNLYKVLVFVEMKHAANRLMEKLEKNSIPSAAIHGNKSQGARQRAIEDFTNDRIRVLVATDIASRGIDIDGITHVINFELPNIPESYVHRIGRTARAGTDGEAISFCTGEERSFLYAIEKTTRQTIPVVTDHKYHSEAAAKASVVSLSAARSRPQSGGGGGRRPSGKPRRGGSAGGGGGGGPTRSGSSSSSGKKPGRRFFGRPK
jgi:ATP-dependent RNA helicase RhlE